MQGAIIILGCVIYSAFATKVQTNFDESMSDVTIVWKYMGDIVFNMLVLVGMVKAAEKISKDMIGFFRVYFNLY